MEAGVTNLDNTAGVLDQDQIAKICRNAFPDRAHRSLLTALGSLYPQIPFSVAWSQEGWYRTGGVVTANGNKITDDLVHWAYREGENDFAGLLEYCRKAALFATRIDGKVHYIVAPIGPQAQDFIQIEVEETQELLDRPLYGESVPVDIEDFIDPVTQPTEQNRPLGAPRYKLKRMTIMADLLMSLHERNMLAEPLWRFLQDWDRSSAAHHHRFCHHWVLELHSYIGRYDEPCYSITARSCYRHSIPHLEDVAAFQGSRLANQIRHFDRTIGYPMAWYFYLLKRDHVSSDLPKTVLEDHHRGYAYLPDTDQQLIQDWLTQPYIL